jgi:hypothetical protein
VDHLLKQGLTADHVLYLAAQDNSVSLCKVLAEKYGASANAPLNAPDGSLDHPLVEAAEEGSASAVLWLLQNGANVEARSASLNRLDGYTALWGACQNGYLRVARILLEEGHANVNTFKVDSGNTALYIAVQNKRQELSTMLLRHGAKVDFVGGDGITPLAVAMGIGHLPLVALLRNAGAKLSEKCLGILGGSLQQGQVSAEKEQAVTELLGGMEYILRYVPNHYKAAQALERLGDYRKALQQIALAETVLHQSKREYKEMWAQLELDQQRLSAAVYGVPGSDGRVSVWHKVHFGNNKQELQPPPLQFYAWASYQNTIYRHGGLHFMKHEQVPSVDALWAFQDNKWKPVSTTGSSSPGPRSGHAACTFKHGLYTFGGKNAQGILDSKLFRLDLQTFQWQVIKTSGAKPGTRDEFACTVYKDKLYIHGGMSSARDYWNDLWCLSFDTCKWKLLSSKGSTARSAHQMWAARDKLYILGGENLKPGETERIRGVQTIQAFEVFDLETKTWQSLRCVGDDPWNLMEYTVLPLCRGQKEPSAILVWGGYVHHDPDMAGPTHKEYGEELSDARLPYRRRLLRLDLETMVWTKLAPISDLEVMPTGTSVFCSYCCV